MSYDIIDAIISSSQKYVISEPCDFVKLIYQASFGGGHLGLELKSVKSQLTDEFEDVKKTVFFHKVSDKTFDSIGNGLARMHIDNLQDNDLDLLSRMFVYTSNKMISDNENGNNRFTGGLEALKSLAVKRKINLDCGELEDYLKEYLRSNLRLVSHSNAYKTAFNPHYRVVFEGFAKFFDAFKKIDEKLSLNKHIIISIDGGAASGKSTLATLISDFYDGNIFKMDDFFLEPKMRSKTRLNEVGGNVQYERVGSVLAGILSKEPFSHDVFDCKSLNYKTKVVMPKKLNVVEGVYCNHKSFNSPYDLKIFLKIDNDLQALRIKQRNGEEMAEMFKNIWIPFENRYFAEWNIEKDCDIVANIE